MDALCDGSSFVGGIGEHLDLEQVSGIVQPANGFNQLFHNVLFVVDPAAAP